MTHLTEEQFDEQYRPLDGPDGSAVWEHADTLDQPADRVWTLVDGDRGSYAVPGYHVVNAWGHAVTEVPWADPDIEAEWGSPDAD